VATNLETGGARLLMTGDGATAVQASTAVPVLFQPVTVDGERLADGALVQPVPVKAARDLGADYVIGVDVAYRPYEEPASGLTQFGFQAMHILINSLAAEEMRGADFPLRLDVHRQLMDCGPESLIAAGREAVRRAWPQLSRSLAARATLAAKP
jgi:NTE family protein